MQILKAFVIGASLMLASGAAAATYPTRSDFDAATATQTTLDFNAATGDDEISYGTTYTDAGVTFTDHAIYNNGPTNGLFAAGFEYGSGYLEWQSGNRIDPSMLTITLPGQYTAVAFDFYELRGESAPFQVIIGGETFNLTTSDTPSFFGFTSANPFSFLVLSMPATVRDAPVFPTIDNFTFGQAAGGVSAVPEPATWALMLTGFLAAGVSLRRRKPLRTGSADQDLPDCRAA